MKLKNFALLADRNGFTLIELMSVMVILGIFFSVAIKKYDQLSDSASITALEAGVRELNTQEILVWTDMKLSETDYSSDVDVYTAVKKDLGRDYSWGPGPAIGGGTLHYGTQSLVLVRTPSTSRTVGLWK